MGKALTRDQRLARVHRDEARRLGARAERERERERVAREEAKALEGLAQAEREAANKLDPPTPENEPSNSVASPQHSDQEKK